MWEELEGELGEGLFKAACPAFAPAGNVTSQKLSTVSQEQRALLHILEMDYKVGTEFSCSQIKERKAITYKLHSIHKS